MLLTSADGLCFDRLCSCWCVASHRGGASAAASGNGGACALLPRLGLRPASGGLPLRLRRLCSRRERAWWSACGRAHRPGPAQRSGVAASRWLRAGHVVAGVGGGGVEVEVQVARGEGSPGVRARVCVCGVVCRVERHEASLRIARGGSRPVFRTCRLARGYEGREVSFSVTNIYPAHIISAPGRPSSASFAAAIEFASFSAVLEPGAF